MQVSSLVSCMKVKQADTRQGDVELAMRTSFEIQLCSQSPQPRCGTNLWSLPEFLTWGFSNYRRAEERIRHPAVCSASGHRVPEGPQQCFANAWGVPLAAESGRRESTESMLGVYNLKVQFRMCPGDSMTVARQDVKHLLPYPCL